MPDYGLDMKCGVDISPTLQDTEGLPLMLDVCTRQLYTPNQSLLSDPSHQSVDLRQMLSTDSMLRPDGTLNLRSVEAAATAALLADPRIFSVSVRVTEYFQEPGYMVVDVTGVGSQGPFALTLGVSRVTIKVLQQ